LILNNYKKKHMKRAFIILLFITAINLRAYTQDTLNVEIVGENRPLTNLTSSLN